MILIINVDIKCNYEKLKENKIALLISTITFDLIINVQFNG